MSTIVEATVPADQFALFETFTQAPDVKFRVVRLVAQGPGQIMPFLWADCGEIDRLRSVIESDQSVKGFDVLVEFDQECLLRIEWGSRVHVLTSILNEKDASILDASGYDGSWHLQIIFPNHDRISLTYELCEEYDIDLSIDRINRLSEASEGGCLDLTEEQYKTLIKAFEFGYYDVPRKISQEELASYFNISHQALSERFRRAHKTVITNALLSQNLPIESPILPQQGREVET